MYFYTSGAECGCNHFFCISLSKAFLNSELQHYLQLLRNFSSSKWWIFNSLGLILISSLSLSYFSLWNLFFSLNCIAPIYIWSFILHMSILVVNKHDEIDFLHNILSTCYIWILDAASNVVWFKGQSIKYHAFGKGCRSSFPNDTVCPRSIDSFYKVTNYLNR